MEENLKTKKSLIENQSLIDIHFKQLETYGIDLDKIAFELQLFKTGIPKANLENAATKNNWNFTIFNYHFCSFLHLHLF